MCACVCVCVCERERETETETERQRQRGDRALTVILICCPEEDSEDTVNDLAFIQGKVFDTISCRRPHSEGVEQ